MGVMPRETTTERRYFGEIVAENDARVKPNQPMLEDILRIA